MVPAAVLVAMRPSAWQVKLTVVPPVALFGRLRRYGSAAIRCSVAASAADNPPVSASPTGLRPVSEA